MSNNNTPTEDITTNNVIEKNSVSVSEAEPEKVAANNAADDKAKATEVVSDEKASDESYKIRAKAERRTAVYELTHGKAVYFMAFIVPLLIMVAVFAMRKIFPFGDNMYLRSDMYHQYCPFFSELWEKLHSGGSLYYSWDIGMGTNFLAVFGYYLSSPINWLIGLLPQKSMPEIMNAIILLKIAGSSLTCTIYLCSHTKRHMGAAMFGLFYGLSGYIAAYSWNLMWLDCIMLFPLVILGLERLVKNGKGLLFTITLGLSILSNYYISIMVCISVVLYYIMLIVSREVHKDKKEYARTTLKFIMYSLLAGAFAATLLLPEVYALGGTASGSMSFPKTMSRYFSFVTMIERHLMNVPVKIGLEHLPNIYCGVMVFLLLPLYIFNKKISKREKVTKVLMLLIFYTAFNLNIPNYVWHGFHYPNSLPCRQAFVYIFLLLGMCYDAFMSIREYKEKHITGSLFAVMAFLIYLGNSIDPDEFDFRIIYTSAVFIGIYAFLLFLMRNKKRGRELLVILMFAISIVECTVNMDKTGYTTTQRSAYFTDYEGVKALMDTTDKDDFVRTTKYRGYRTKNDDAWHNFKGTSVFSSTAYASLTKLYGQLGLEHSTNAYAINGATPLIYSLFDVKYLLSNRLVNGDAYSFVASSEGTYLYENKYALPVAFMVPDTFNNNWNPDKDNNPFNVQNSMAYELAGVSDLYTRLTFEDNVSTAVIRPETDTYLYMYIMNKNIETIYVTIDGSSETFTGVNHGRMIDLGYVPAGAEVHVKSNDAEANLQMYAYSMDFDKYTQVIDSLKDEGIQVTKYNDTMIKGNITAKKDGLMFTSIPYDEGWTVYVDGKKTDYTSIGDKGFIAVDLSAGSHEIEFKFYPRGLKIGRIMSILALLIIVGFIAFRVKFKHEITEIGSMNIITDKLKIKKTATAAGKEDEE